MTADNFMNPEVRPQYNEMQSKHETTQEPQSKTDDMVATVLLLRDVNIMQNPAIL